MNLRDREKWRRVGIEEAAEVCDRLANSDSDIECDPYVFAAKHIRALASRTRVRGLRAAARAVVDAWHAYRDAGSFTGFWTHIDDLSAQLDGRNEQRGGGRCTIDRLETARSALSTTRVPLIDNGRGQLVYAPTDKQASEADAFIRSHLAAPVTPPPKPAVETPICLACGQLPPHEGCQAVCPACAPENGTCGCAGCIAVRTERETLRRKIVEAVAPLVADIGEPPEIMVRKAVAWGLERDRLRRCEGGR